jgi:hypothetical protein
MRILGIFGSVIAAAVLLAAPARASILLSGNTAGCFDTCSSYGTTNVTDMGLVFNAVTGSGGFYNSTNTKGYATLFNLGTFALLNTIDDYSNETFSLKINFTSPTSTSPSTGYFSAVLDGSVTAGPDGGVTVNFGPKEWFNFAGGSFSLLLNPVSIQPNDSPAYISAQVQAVPEPGTWALMGIGFACVGLMAYRRRGRGPTLRFV